MKKATKTLGLSSAVFTAAAFLAGMPAFLGLALVAAVAAAFFAVARG